MLETLKDAGVGAPDSALPGSLRAKHGTNVRGKRIHYFLNYSGVPVTFTYGYGRAHDLLSGEAVQPGASVEVRAWDLALLEED